MRIKQLPTLQPSILYSNNLSISYNYRFVEMCIQRLLGRQVYNEQEKLAWSIVIGTKGLNGFIATEVSMKYLRSLF